MNNYPKRAPTVWTPERIEALRWLAADGKSAKQIAEIMALTRQGIEGACRKYGIKLAGNAGRLWSAERDATLRELVAAQKTGREIAVIMGISRNAVLGRLHRLGLSLYHPPGWNSAKANAKPRSLWKTPARRPRQPRPQRPAPPVVLLCEPVALLGLKPCHCRWPVLGDGADTLFCGAQIEPERPYCPGHCAPAYKAPITSRRDFIRGLRRYAA